MVALMKILKGPSQTILYSPPFDKAVLIFMDNIKWHNLKLISHNLRDKVG
jgi:hypothetical protein